MENMQDKCHKIVKNMPKILTNTLIIRELKLMYMIMYMSEEMSSLRRFFALLFVWW